MKFKYAISQWKFSEEALQIEWNKQMIEYQDTKWRIVTIKKEKEKIIKDNLTG